MFELRKILREWVPTIVIALGLSLVVRTEIAEPRWIPSESMLPTLKVGDHLMVDKVSMKFEGINRGDIVVFKAPPSLHKEEDLIKRVIGLPGEQIVIKDGTVYINGEPLKETYIAEKPNSDFGPFTVPKDEVFVMGDNRNGSYDSRFWGPLPLENIIGKALFRYYPLNTIGVMKDN